MYLLFNSDIVNLVLNINGVEGGETEGLNLLIFVVWSTLIVGGWVGVGGDVGGVEQKILFRTS